MTKQDGYPKQDVLHQQPKNPVKVDEASNPGERITNPVTETNVPNTKDDAR